MPSSTWPLVTMLGPEVSVLGAGCWQGGPHVKILLQETWLLKAGRALGSCCLPKQSSAPWEVWLRAFILMLFCSLILEGAVENN